MDGRPLDLGEIGVMVLVEEVAAADREEATLMRSGISGDALEETSSGTGVGSGSRFSTAGVVAFDVATDVLALVDV